MSDYQRLSKYVKDSGLRGLESGGLDELDIFVDKLLEDAIRIATDACSNSSSIKSAIYRHFGEPTRLPRKPKKPLIR